MAKLDNYAFPVQIQKLVTEKGHKTDRLAIVRSDNKAILGIVSNQYHLIKHSEVIDSIEKTLPVALKTKSIHVCNGGALVFARYQSPKIKNAEPRKGDIVSFGIEVFNSYNGRVMAGMRTFATRLVCSNGMTVPRSISSITIKHTHGANIINAREAFDSKIQQFIKYQEIWKKWTTMKLTKGTAKTYLDKNIKSAKAKIIISSKYEMDGDETVWGLFNSLTWFGTHVLRTRGTDETIVSAKITDLPAKKLENTARLQFAWDRNIIEPFYSKMKG